MVRLSRVVMIFALFASMLPAACVTGGIPDVDRELSEKTEAMLNRKSYRSGEWTIPYLEYPVDGAPGVLFLHGAPGSLKSFISYFERDELAGKYTLVSLDRPGYGDVEPKRSLPSVAGQATRIGPILDVFVPGKPVVVVGHSFGGPIAMKLAIDHPDVVRGVILLAPTLFPELERIFWFNKPARWPVLRPFIPQALLVANEEKWAHIAELGELNEEMRGYDGAVTIIHGTEDSLVPVENATQAAELLTQSDTNTIILDGIDHFIPWSHEDLVVQEILAIVAKAEANRPKAIEARQRD